MKNLNIVIMFFLVLGMISCNEGSSGTSKSSSIKVTEPVVADEDQVTEEIEEEIVVAEPEEEVLEDYVLLASKSYEPEFSLNDELKIDVEKEASYLLPMEINVLQGNAGKGWIELIVGNKKFCYKGQAKHKAQFNKVFRLKFQKKNVKDECKKKKTNVALDPVVSLKKNTVLKLNLLGGGCSKTFNTCKYTEVEAELKPFVSNLIY
jgi:hypothetical protein